VVTALYERERTGRGRVVDVAMIDTIYPVLTSNLTGYYRTGAAPRAGNGHGGAPLVPYNVYPCAGDGYVAIIVVTETHWRSLCGAMARPELADDERFSSNAMRFRNLEELDRLVADWARSLDRDEIVARLRGAHPLRRGSRRRGDGRGSPPPRARRHPTDRPSHGRRGGRPAQPVALPRHPARTAHSEPRSGREQPGGIRGVAGSRGCRARSPRGGRRHLRRAAAEQSRSRGAPV